MKKLWQNLVEMWTMYRVYEIGKIYKWYRPGDVKEMFKLLRLYLNKENNA